MAARGRQRGVALVMVLLLLTLVSGVIVGFTTSSSLDLQLAYAGRDELQAELSAMSVFRMRALLLKQRTKLQMIAQMVQNAGAPGGGGGGGGVPLGPILQRIPVTCDLLNALARTASADGSQAWEGDFFPGDCMAESTSEHGKIALNLLAKGSETDAKQVRALLTEVLAIPALAPLFEADDRQGGQHAESPVALVAHITDWVDADRNEWGGFGDEDRYYQYRPDPYRAKNAPMDSLAELRLVHGVSDLVYGLLGGIVSVHKDQAKIELGTASAQVLAVGLMSLRRPEAPMELALAAVPQVVRSLGQAQALGGGMSMTLLQATLTASGADRLFDLRGLKEVFSEKDDATWYQITALGQVHRSSRRLRVIFQAPEAQFYYARLD